MTFLPPNSPLFTSQQLAPVNTGASGEVGGSLVPQLPEKPIASTTSMQMYIIPTEKKLFFQGFESNEYDERQPVLLRGCLFLRVLKQSKVKSISLTFQGHQRTDWPEGIPPKRNLFSEETDIIKHTWPFYSMSNPLNSINGGADLYSELPKHLDRDISHLNLNDSSTNRAHSPSVSTIDSLNLNLNTVVSNNNGNNSNNNNNSNSNSNINTTTGSFLFRSLGGGGNNNNNTGTNTNNNGNSLLPKRTASPSLHPVDSFNELATVNTAESDIGKPGTFPPGDYIYNFEHPLRPSLPETTNVTFGEVEYNLEATIIRAGAFKSNLTGKLPMTLVRTPSELNMEENEPIVITRDWEDQLRYDIVIGGKSIILDSYLPLAFRFVPLWGKVALHRIRVYLTENLEYYCQNKKVHRMEPSKKYLLLEHKAKKGKSLLSKKENGEYGNETDELLPRELEFQLYVPQTLNGKVHHVLHPDTSYEDIQSHHWIKLCLRISKVDPENPEKRKHYEISIDSPIHVLSPLAAHGNTLLPAYDDHLITNESSFLPEYTPSSPPLSPGVTPVDNNTQTIGKLLHALNRSNSLSSNKSQKEEQDLEKIKSSERFYHINSTQNNDEPIERDLDMHLEANLYKPDINDSRSQLTSPQAVPHPDTFSPLSSPVVRPIHVLRRPSYNPPPFDADAPPPSIDNNGELPPPAYELEDSGSNNSSFKLNNDSLTGISGMNTAGVGNSAGNTGNRNRSRTSSNPSASGMAPTAGSDISIRDLLTNSFSNNNNNSGTNISHRNSVVSKRSQSSNELKKGSKISLPDTRNSNDSNNVRDEFKESLVLELGETSTNTSTVPSFTINDSSNNTLDKDDPLSPKLEEENEDEEDIVDMIGSPELIPSAVTPRTDLSPLNSPRRGMSPLGSPRRGMSPLNSPRSTSPVRGMNITDKRRGSIKLNDDDNDNNANHNDNNDNNNHDNEGYLSSVESTSRRGSIGSSISNDLNMGQKVPLLNLSTQSLLANYPPPNTRTASVGSMLFDNRSNNFEGGRRLSSTNRPSIVDFVDGGDLGGDYLRSNMNFKGFKSYSFGTTDRNTIQPVDGVDEVDEEAIEKDSISTFSQPHIHNSSNFQHDNNNNGGESSDMNLSKITNNLRYTEDDNEDLTKKEVPGMKQGFLIE